MAVGGQTRREIKARLTSWIACVTSMPRGQASVQLKRRAAAPDTLAVVEDVEPLRGPLVAAVEDEPVGPDDRLRAEVLPVGPEDRA